MFDTIRETWDAIKLNKMRTLATGFAVISGIFLLIVLQGAGNGIIHTLENDSGGLALDAVSIYPGYTSKPFKGMREGRYVQLDERDMGICTEAFEDNVVSASAVIDQSAYAVYGTNTLNFNLEGVYPQYEEAEAVKVLQGRFVNELDLREKRKVIVMGDKSVEKLFPAGEKVIGKNVTIGGVVYNIVGIHESNVMSGGDLAYVPYSTLRVIYGKGRFIDELTLKTTGLETEEKNTAFEEDLRKVMGQVHAFDPQDNRALWIWNSASENVQLSTAKTILRTSFWILGLLTLLSGIVGVSNIMLIAVKERTHEFGIRKALGAKPWSIIKMIMLESVMITASFGYVGMFLGILFCEYMNVTVGNQTMDVGMFEQKYFIDPTVDLSTCVQATVVIIVSGALAGFIPTRKAAKVKPIEALRAE